MKTTIFSILFVILACAAWAQPVIYSHQLQGEPGPTISETAADTVQTLAANLSSDIMTHNGRKVLAVLITVESNPIRFALGGTSATDTVGHVMNAGDSIRIVGHEMVRTFSYINDNAGSNAVLMITPEY